MIKTKVSAAVAGVVVIGVLVWNPLATRAQNRLSSPVAAASNAPNTLTSSNLLTTAAQASAVATIAQTVAVKAVEASALEVIEFRPLDRHRAAETYPLPERKYIRSGLWEVGTTELDQYYHTFDCPRMRRSSRNYIYGFPTWREAQVAGYQPHLGCTPSPLHELIAQVREARRKVTQRGQPPSAVTDTELMRIRTETGALNISEKILDAMLGKMLGRPVIMAPPGAQVLAPGDQTGGDNSGMGGGLPQGSGGSSSMGMGSGGPAMQGMGGGGGSRGKMSGS